MIKKDKENLFKFIINCVKDVSIKNNQPTHIAFVKWFVEMAYQMPNIYHTDGYNDGKVDAFFSTTFGNNVKHYVVNSKYTSDLDRQAPVNFYDEIITFNHLFAESTKEQREGHLQNVKPALRPHYLNLFEQYDEGAVELIFITNCKINQKQFLRAKGLPVTVYHLEDLMQFLLDDSRSRNAQNSSTFSSWHS